MEALSELVESFRGDEDRQIVREEFEEVLGQYVNGPRATQQIAQLWDKVSWSYCASRCVSWCRP